MGVQETVGLFNFNKINIRKQDFNVKSAITDGIKDENLVCFTSRDGGKVVKLQRGFIKITIQTVSLLIWFYAFLCIF